MANSGLLALSGLGHLLGGIGQGAVAADTLGQHQRLLDLTQRAQDLQNQARYTDLTPLAQIPGLESLASAGRVQPAVADKLLAITEARRIADVEQQRRGQLAEVAAQTDPGLAALIRTGAIPGAEVMHRLYPTQEYVSGAPGTTPFSKQTGLPPAGVTPSPKLTQHIVQTPDGPQVVTTDYEGNVVRTTPTGLESPESRGVYRRSDIEKQLQLEGLQPGNLTYQQRYNDLARQIMIGPGGGVVGAGTGLGGPQPPQPPPGPQGRVPGEPPLLAQRKPLTTEAETETVGKRNSTIEQLQAAANLGAKMPQLQDASGRASLRMRSWVQGNTPFEALTPEEQAWVTTHDRLRIMFTEATMGLGPFRSPEMQAQLKEIIGRYWTPGTAERLQALADNLRQTGAAVQGAQAEGGRRPLSLPPRTQAPGTVAPPGFGGAPAPAAPTGTRIRVRSKADPTRMGWINAGEPIPSDVEVVR